MTKVTCGIVTEVTMQGTLQEGFHCIRSRGGAECSVTFEAALRPRATRHAKAALTSAADIQRASLSRRADGLFTCQACAYGCVACVKSERVLSSKMRMDACVKFED